jgi:hypothetical protein
MFIHTQAEELASYFRAAAEERRLLEPRRTDRKWITEGKTIIHAVDVDVVVLYTNPFEEAVRRSERRPFGYGEVFPGDEQSIAIGLGQILAHFIFFRLSENNSLPLLLLPPIDQELREVFGSVMRKAMTEGVKAREQVNEIQKLATKIKTISDENERFRQLVEAAPDLFRFLAGARGPRAEFERFSRLLGKKRVTPLDQLLGQGLGTDENCRQAFLPPEKFADRIRLISRSHDWFDRIKGTGAHAKSAARIQDDAMMLARLEWINQRLGDDARLVLITGDRSIHTAARNYFPDNGKYCFTELWLRHPRSYLAEPEVLSPERGDEADSDFINWLDTFLGKLELTGRDYMVELDKLLNDSTKRPVKMAAKVLESHPNILEDFKTRWTEYASRAILANESYVIPESADNDHIGGLVRTISDQLQEVEEILHHKVSLAWDGIFDTAIEAGFLFARQKDSTLRSRNPPLLSFETLNCARVFLESILAKNKEQPIEDFEKRLEELREEELSVYTFPLIFGVLFAAQGAWAVTEILAKRALEIVQTNKGKRSYITGREAYYLQSVARRHHLRKMSELCEVEALLRQAEECLNKEREERPNLLNGDCRFSSERVALNVSYQLFERFCGEKIPATVPSLVEIESKLKELLKLNAENLSPPNNPKLWVARNVERKLLTNLFMVILLNANRERAFPQDLEPYFNRYKISVEGSDDEKPIPSTFFIDAVYRVTQWWKEQNPTERKRIKDDIQLYLRDEEIKRNTIMPYDVSRFTFLRNFVNS